MLGFVLLVMVVPLAFVSCSILPNRETIREKATEVRDVTEEKLREKWSSEWKPALVAEGKKVGAELTSELAKAIREMLSAQAASYRADLEAKVSAGTATTTERWIYWALGALGLLGTGKGVQQGSRLKSMLTAIITAVEVASRDGKGLDLKEIIKAEATKLGVDSLLYPIVQAVAAKIKPPA